MFVRSETLRSALKAIKIILMLSIIPILIFLAFYIPNIINENKAYKAALNDFQTICEYVQKNQEVYERFSEYQISLLEYDTDSFYIKQEGEYQEERDIVLKYANESNVRYIDDSGMVIYVSGNDRYDITIIYGKDINQSGRKSTETYRTIGDNIYIYAERRSFD